jgi:hypothetical protein
MKLNLLRKNPQRRRIRRSEIVEDTLDKVLGLAGCLILTWHLLAFTGFATGMLFPLVISLPVCIVLMSFIVVCLGMMLSREWAIKAAIYIFAGFFPLSLLLFFLPGLPLETRLLPLGYLTIACYCGWRLRYGSGLPSVNLGRRANAKPVQQGKQPNPRRRWPIVVAVVSALLAVAALSVSMLAGRNYSFVRAYGGELRSGGRFTRLWGPVAGDDCFAFRTSASDLLADMSHELKADRWLQVYNDGRIAVFQRNGPKGIEEAQFESMGDPFVKSRPKDLPTCVVWLPHAEPTWVTKQIEKVEKALGIRREPEELNIMAVRGTFLDGRVEARRDFVSGEIAVHNISPNPARIVLSEILLKDSELLDPQPGPIALKPWSTETVRLRFPNTALGASDFDLAPWRTQALLTYSWSNGPGELSSKGTPRHPKARIRGTAAGKAELVLTNPGTRRLLIRKLQLLADGIPFLKLPGQSVEVAGSSTVPISRKPPPAAFDVSVRAEYSLDNGLHWHAFDIDLIDGTWPNLNEF